ncbi:Ig-like domain-containing protein [Blastococcus saxobsidens]|uniref:N-acetylmuramoyl-L-alanine amidase n=1 Tax=Blastococcus saxobsidens TaxID=138336 RepID=A0A4Q7Y8J3_9ACTN|nr:Ig-like domain-containing protein [Blastococcus saxobsidens]RZU32613.1 N-acetylmuramoyl-L-alanine amidase [Blastococcus saxobsidens]
MRIVLRLVTVLAVFLGLTLVVLPVSRAIESPATLADRRPVGVGAVEPGFPIDYLGVLWDTRGADEHAEDQAEEHGAVRFRVDGAWTAWHPLTEDGAHAEGQWASALVPAGDAEAYQVRGIPAHAGAPRAVALNTTDGPLVEVGRRPAGGASAVDSCVSRAEWKADETLRFDDQGNELWPTEFHPVQTMTVHHTATKNGDTDPAATVRAIYRYHAVDRGWGDIGYHYLIDEAGLVYEGRWSGADPQTGSQPCATGGDGSDFAHDGGNGLVTAGHTGGYNSGNMGAALLGDFTTHPRNGAEPAAPAVDALERLLAEFASRHQLDPHAVVDYVNPVDGATNTVDMISGHRDWTSTECPGERLYAQLPAIRDAVAAQKATLSVSVTSPADGATVAGTISVAAEAPGATGVTFSVGGAEVAGTLTNGVWSVSWDTTAAAEGAHTVTASATDGTSTATDSIAVVVDNVADPVVKLTGPADGATLTGSVDVTADPTGTEGVARIDFSLDGKVIVTDTTSADGWTWSWDTVGDAEGAHVLTATVVDTAGQQSSDSRSVTVDNVTVGSVTPSSGKQGTTVQVVITGTGFASGATVDLQNGEGTEPVVSGVSVASDGTSLTATFTIGKTSGPRKDRPWDIAVINPDGTSAVLVDGFTVLR